MPSGQVVVAPGQIATLQVIGLKTILPQPLTASNVPLPTVLDGISVTIQQEVIDVVTTLPVPQVAISQSNGCGSYPPTVGCTITWITVEIPMETMPKLFPGAWPVSWLAISENGVNSQEFSIVPLPANTHFLTATHADGSLITAKSPAKASETIVIYAYGLGQTTPFVPAGAVTPIPAPQAANYIYVDFNFSPNAGPTYPYIDPKQGPVNVPAFAGLTPGQIGLYQVNVKLPDNFPAVSACSNAFSPYYSAIMSNLTIDITTYYNLGGLSDGAAPSFDAAPICVQPPVSQ